MTCRAARVAKRRGRRASPSRRAAPDFALPRRSLAGGRALFDPEAQELALAVGHARLVQERHGSLDGSPHSDSVGKAAHVGSRVEHDTAGRDREGDLRVFLRMTAQTVPLDHCPRCGVRDALWLTSWRADERPGEEAPS